MIGVIAQLGERLNGIQEVGGSIPLNSTINLNTSIIIYAFCKNNLSSYLINLKSKPIID